MSNIAPSELDLKYHITVMPIDSKRAKIEDSNFWNVLFLYITKNYIQRVNKFCLFSVLCHSGCCHILKKYSVRKILQNILQIFFIILMKVVGGSLPCY